MSWNMEWGALEERGNNITRNGQEKANAIGRLLGAKLMNFMKLSSTI